MRYIAALLSICMHLLFVFIFLDTVFVDYGRQFDGFNIELVSLSESEQKLIDKSEIPESLPDKSLKAEDSGSMKRSKPEKPTFKPDRSIARKPSQKPETGNVAAGEQRRIEAASKAGKPGGRSAVSADKAKAVVEKKVLESAPEIETGSSSAPNAIVLRQGKGVTVGNNTVVLKRGSESRSLDSIAGYSFNENDFRGHYETSTGRQVVIIDARHECGRLVLHDRKTGLLRKLKKAGLGDFIYTYGPSFNEDEPVKGSVVFLPGDEHWIHRFMWLPEDEAAEYPVKGRVDSYGGSEAKRSERLFVPAAKGRFPAVVLVPFGRKIPFEQFAEVARHLCGRGVVVLCAESFSSADVSESFKILHGHDKVDPERIGVWARGYEPEKMPRIPITAGRFGFIILTVDHPDGRLYSERVASVIPDNLPVFIGFRGVSSDWKRMVPIALTGFKVAPHLIKIIDAASPVVAEVGTDPVWVDSLSGDFVSSISAWIDSR